MFLEEKTKTERWNWVSWDFNYLLYTFHKANRKQEMWQLNFNNNPVLETKVVLKTFIWNIQMVLFCS